MTFGPVSRRAHNVPLALSIITFLAAVLTLPAFGWAAGVIVSLDPVTRLPVAPNPEQLHTTEAAWRAAFLAPAASDAPLPVVRLPGGGELVHLNGRFGVYSIAQRGANGRIVTECAPDGGSARRLPTRAGRGDTAPQATASSTIALVNMDQPGEGFNDPTPVTPVGGNPGCTLGAQRLNVFLEACAIWGTILPSTVAIRVEAHFEALPCDATSGILGGANIVTEASDFAGAPIANTWYAIALANKLAGTDLAPGYNDIAAVFNSSVDNSTCLGATNWYYGYDHEEGTHIDLLAVVLHELGHGLGFLTLTGLTTGVFLNGRPDIYSRNLFDRSYGLRWDQLTDQQRAASAVNTGNLVWDGPYVRQAASLFLGPAPIVRIDEPAGIAGEKQFGTADFGVPPPEPSLTAEVVLVEDAAFPTIDACQALVNAPQLAGKIALIDRGTCLDTDKAKRAQLAGAIAAILGNNTGGRPPALTGSDTTITIPVVSISQSDAAIIQDELWSGGTVVATIGVDPTHLAGTDAEGRPRMYAPAPLMGGSSVSHWDRTATPNLLMEAFLNRDLTSNVDLTQYAFVDMGWLGGAAAVAVDGPAPSAPRAYAAPNPFAAATTIRFQTAEAGRAVMEVFDARGSLVKRLPLARLPAGPQAVVWDGTNVGGRRAPGGVYFWRVSSGGAVQTGRMVRVE
jgi:hypothetical protein